MINSLRSQIVTSSLKSQFVISNIPQVPLYIIMASGEDKFYQIFVPAEYKPGLETMPDFPIIAFQALKTYALMDKPVLRQNVDCLKCDFLDLRFVFRGKRF